MSLMGIVVVKFTHAVARVVKGIEVRAGRRATFGTGFAAPFVTLLTTCWSWAPTSLCHGAVTVGSWPPRASHKAGLVFRPTGLFTFLFSVLESFSYPARRFLHARDQQRLHSLHRRGTCLVNGTAPEVGPLTSSPSSRGQSLGVALWRAGYTPGDRLTSLVYSTTCCTVHTSV